MFALLFSVDADPIKSGVYDWKQPAANIQREIRSSVLFEGTAHDMEWMQMNANELKQSNRKANVGLPGTEEHLYIVRKGTLTVTLKDSTYSLVPGSVLVLMPGEMVFIQNKLPEPCSYYVLKLRSKLPADRNRGEESGGSIVVDWTKVPFRSHGKGGVRNYFERPTAMGTRLEMHVTTLNAGLKSHDPHTHRAEELVIMIEGNTEMQIGEQFYKGKEGSVFFLGSNISHAIRNEGTTACTYFAFQFE